MSEELDVQAIVTSSRSDVGRTRSENQDSCGDFLHLAGARLLILADGMGGHRGGRRASRICVDAFARIFKDQSGGPEDQLRDAFALANDEIYTTALEDEELRGMGTTGVALLIAKDGSALVGWVGDSRAYRLRDGELEQVTEDHSLVAEWVRLGVLSPEQAEHHPRRSELTRAIGVQPDVEAEIKPADVRPGDRFLLCSDGLSGLVPEVEIRSILGSQDPSAAVESLVDRANAAGGTDNVSVQIALLPLPQTDDAPAFAALLDAERGTEPSSEEDRIAPLSLPEPREAPRPQQVVITEPPGLHGASAIVGAAIAIVGLTIGYVALTRLGSEPSGPPTSHHDIAPPEPLPPPGDPLDSAPTLELEVEGPPLPQPPTPEALHSAQTAATSQTEPAEPAAPVSPTAALPSEPTEPTPAPVQEPAADPTPTTDPVPPAPQATAASTPGDETVPPPAPPPPKAEPQAAPNPEPSPNDSTSAQPAEPPPDATEPTETPPEPSGELVAEANPTPPEPDAAPSALPNAHPQSASGPPIEIPTTAAFQLEPELHEFLDGWLRAAATRDFGLYHQLGFPDPPELFGRTYRRWEGFRFEQIEVDAARSKPGKMYVRAVLSYVFEDDKGRWRTEDEHRLILLSTPDGRLRYEARWK